MILSIHQPEHMPWLGFLNKLDASDTFVILDNVQYRHKYFQNRNKIKGANGPVWLNVPVGSANRRETKIKDIQINNNSNWGEKNWKSMHYAYGKSKYFKDYSGYFESTFLKEWTNLCDLNIDIIENLLGFLEIETNIQRASELPVKGQGEKLILDLCKHYSPEVYISGITGIAGHGDRFENEFVKAGIKVAYQDFTHPVYEQNHLKKKDFVPYMSAIDLLFNYGEQSIDIIRSGWSIK